MKALCITGADNEILEKIATPFFQAGMGSPRELQREKPICFNKWHQQVNDFLENQQPVGKLWEHLANELILANLDIRCWGWYETLSVNALDFWADLDPSIRFLLVCSTPENELAQTMMSNSEEISATERLENWYQRHQKMLKFYLKYPDRCLLIDAEEALNHLSGQFALAHKYWKLPLDRHDLNSQSSKEDEQKLQYQPSQLSKFLAKELIKVSKLDIYGLCKEIRSAQYPFFCENTDNDEEDKALLEISHSASDKETLEKLFIEYQELYKMANNSLQLNKTLNAQLAELAEQNEREGREAANTISKVQQELEGSKQENELLLVRLHQTQEELEHYLNKTLNAQLAELAEQNEREGREAANTVSKVQQELEGSKQENELLLVRLHQTQEELEYYFREHEKVSNQNNQLELQLRKAQQLIHDKSQSPRGIIGNILRKNKSPVPKLHYADIELRSKKVNPDYEYLWITLKEPSFGENFLDEWHFRLSCANVTRKKFGTQPKLELPEQKPQLLENWFIESQDEYGGKLELRFALPGAMDTGVWKQLSKQDQQLLSSLIKQLPDMIKQLKNQKANISRSWKDWERLVADMQRIHRKKSG